LVFKTLKKPSNFYEPLNVVSSCSKSLFHTFKVNPAIPFDYVNCKEDPLADSQFSTLFSHPVSCNLRISTVSHFCLNAKASDRFMLKIECNFLPPKNLIYMKIQMKQRALDKEHVVSPLRPQHESCMVSVRRGSVQIFYTYAKMLQIQMIVVLGRKSFKGP
jgi:hypothetical protein